MARRRTDEGYVALTPAIAGWRAVFGDEGRKGGVKFFAREIAVWAVRRGDGDVVPVVVVDGFLEDATQVENYVGIMEPGDTPEKWFDHARRERLGNDPGLDLDDDEEDEEDEGGDDGEGDDEDDGGDDVIEGQSRAVGRDEEDEDDGVPRPPRQGRGRGRSR